MAYVKYRFSFLSGKELDCLSHFPHGTKEEVYLEGQGAESTAFHTDTISSILFSLSPPPKFRGSIMSLGGRHADTEYI